MAINRFPSQGIFPSRLRRQELGQDLACLVEVRLAPACKNAVADSGALCPFEDNFQIWGMDGLPVVTPFVHRVGEVGPDVNQGVG